MSANINPIFAYTPNVGQVGTATANTNRDGTGTLYTVLTAGANGTMVNRLTAVAQAGTSASFLRLFLFDGTDTHLYEELATGAATPSGTVAAGTALSQKITPQTPLVLPTGWSLKVSTNNAEVWHVTAEGGDF